VPRVRPSSGRRRARLAGVPDCRRCRQRGAGRGDRPLPGLRDSRVRRTAEDIGVRRAASVCGAPNCPNVAVLKGRCREHAPKPWAGSEQSRDRRGVLRGHALQKVRRRRIREAGGRCQRCGRFDLRLVLHHLSELDDYDATLVLCERCHGREHRRTWMRARSRLPDDDLVSNYRVAITPDWRSGESTLAHPTLTYLVRLLRVRLPTPGLRAPHDSGSNGS
jgi:5-methylcytosine-specific restriction endonuclease McrA